MLSVYVAGVLGVVGGFRLLSLAWNAMEDLPLGVGKVATKIREGWVDATWQSKILQLATPAIMLTAGTLLLSQHIQLRGAGRLTKASEWEPSVGEWALGYVQEGTYAAEQMVMSPKSKRQNRVVSLRGSDPRLRKMINDTNLSPQEAMSRLEISAEGVGSDGEPVNFYGNPRKIATDRWGNRRFIRRRKDGTYMKNVDVGRSLRMDARKQAKTWAPAGYRDMGDGSPSLLERLKYGLGW